MSQTCLKKFECILCNYKSSNKSDYNKHLQTGKHKKMSLRNILETQNPQTITQKNCNDNLNCINCDKIFETRSGLWKHKKKCNTLEQEKSETSNNQIILTNDLIIKLLNDNKEMREIIMKQQEYMTKQQEYMTKQQDQICELLPKIGNNNNNNNNTK